VGMAEPTDEQMIESIIRNEMINREAKRRIEQMDRLGVTDPYDEGQVIRWNVKFRDKDTIYTYVAIKIGDVYYTTAKFGGVKTWDEIKMQVVCDSTIDPNFQILESNGLPF